MYRKKLQEIYENNKKNDPFFEKVGITKENFRKLFTGKSTPNISTILRISDALNVTPASVLGWESDEQLRQENADLKARLDTLAVELELKNEQLHSKDELLRAKTELLDSLKERLAERDSRIETITRELAVLRSNGQDAQTKKGALPEKVKPSL